MAPAILERRERVMEREGRAEDASLELAPERVVREVVAACGVSAEAGAKTLWKFGSHRLRRSSGAPEHLARHLGNELFHPLLQSEGADFEPLQRLDGAARQVVIVRTGEGEPTRFLFALARASSGERAGCWLVSGLERE